MGSMGVGTGLYMYVVVVQKFTFAISSPDEFLLRMALDSGEALECISNLARNCIGHGKTHVVDCDLNIDFQFCS